MSFRSRLFVAFTIAALAPLGMLAFGVRREMTRRLTAANARRGEAAVSALRQDLASESATVASRCGPRDWRCCRFRTAPAAS